MYGSKVFVIGFAFVLLIIIGGTCVYPYATAKTDTITIGEKWIKTAGENKQIYMVSDQNKNPYCVTDCFGRFHFRATDVYLKMEVGKTYKVTYYGWRVPIFSGYPNIVSAVQVSVDSVPK
jgi:hypothetical protein